MSDTFPFIGNTIQNNSISNLPLFIEYAWNFDTDKFIYDDAGNHVIVHGNEAIKVWIYKALKTHRYSYLAYSSQYGIDLKEFIGKVMTYEERISELKRIIIECLMVNPYIKSINSITFNREKEKLKCYVDLTTIYGDVNIDV